MPVTHLPVLSQQPVGQVVGLQADAWQAWLMHCWPPGHAWQGPPPFPQALIHVPGWHFPFWQQP